LILDPSDPADNYLEAFADGGGVEELVFLFIDDGDDGSEPVGEGSGVVGRAAVGLEDALVEPGSRMCLHLGDEVETHGEELL
jgi:hypothetical protein